MTKQHKNQPNQTIPHLPVPKMSKLWAAASYNMAEVLMPALSTLGGEQAEATDETVADAKHLLDYLAPHPDARLRYYESDMILNVHSGA
jgi:hypothetical protein